MSPDQARLLSRIKKVNDCWIINGFLNRGYGSFSFNGKTFKAHRAAYQIFRGEIPEGLCVLHKCDVRSCVNPEHLFLGTYKDNAQDAVSKGRNYKGGAKIPQNKRKTHCIHGHEFTAENTYTYSEGRRQCKECVRIRGYARRAKAAAIKEKDNG